MSKRNGKTPPKGIADPEKHQRTGSGKEPEALKPDTPQSPKLAPGAVLREVIRSASPQSNPKSNANATKQERKHA